MIKQLVYATQCPYAGLSDEDFARRFETHKTTLLLHAGKCHTCAINLAHAIDPQGGWKKA